MNVFNSRVCGSFRQNQKQTAKMKVSVLITALTAVIAGVTGQKQYDLRLVDGSSDLEGRVEVFVDSAWGTVCDNQWDMDDATVVCRQLGYGRATSAPGSAHFDQGSGNIVFDEVTCKGSETSLYHCTMNYNNDCTHSEDAGVVCSQPDTYDVRLVGGMSNLEGRVEVYVSGAWGTVQDNGWDSNDAAVVCRQLGYAEAISAPVHAFFSPGSGQVVFSEVACNGTEQELHECSRGDWNPNNHQYDAGVVCNNHTNQPAQYDVRLMDGNKYHEGRVEVYVDGAWQGAICASTFDIEDATVVCRQLGFWEATASDAYFGEGNRTIVFTNVTCAGTESNLHSCSFSNHSSTEWGCQDAGVLCRVNRPDQYDVRLVGDYLEGRVEAFVDGAWGTVCDDLWDIDDATVVCWQLGHGKATSAPGSAYFGQGSGNIVFDDVNCQGTESHLHDCVLKTYNNCSHSEDAGVICSQPDQFDVRLVGGSSKLEGRVEVYAGMAWWSVCDHGWDVYGATVVCMQLGYGKAKSAPGSAYFGQGSGDVHVLIDEFNCQGTESSLRDCVLNTYGDCSHRQDAGVICRQPEDYDVRLVGGSHNPGGRVEVFVGGAWGTVCDDGWDIDDATVVCRQMGYGKATSAPGSAYFGQGSGNIVFDDVNCQGTESNLNDCALKTSSNDCTHREDAGVVCRKSEDYDVRLVGGNRTLEGRVEVFVDGAWGTVCDDQWDIDDATVVCRQLGYGKATSAPGSAYFGQGSGDIVLTNVACMGTESSLHYCSSDTSTGLCEHKEDAGVVCTDATNLPDQYDVRLVDGSSTLEGRVEVFVGSAWGTVCDDLWDIEDATVVCWQLGYGKATSAPGSAYFGQGSGNIVFDDVNCQGTESHLHDCVLKTYNDCTHSEDAGVVCSQPEDYDVRLVGGNNNAEGRVEVYVGGTWGTVCDDLWDIDDATVVCRQLDFKAASSAPGSAYFGQGSGDIVLTNVACMGTESSLHYCSSDTSTRLCGHYEDAGVVCTDATNLPDEYDVRLVGGSSDLEGRVEVYVDGAWGTVCDDGWDLDDATVVCWQLGHGKPTSAPGSAYFGPGSEDIVLDDVDCKGTESVLDECTFNTNNDCTHNEDAGVVCSQPEEYDIQLVGGSSQLEGRVEVYLNGAWGTVCDDQWDIDDATVVCRQLGYGKATSAPGSAYFGQGSGTIVYSNAVCTGGEHRLNDCSIGTYEDYCDHSEDAGVVCSASDTAEQGSVRLVGGSSQYEGRVEIYLDGQWGTICDGWSVSWDNDAADVVCKQLGYGYADSVETESTFGPGTGRPILMDGVICYGYESALDQCSYDSSPTCTHQSDVGVKCHGPGLSTGAIVGIAAAVILAVTVGIAAVVRYCQSSPRQTGSRAQAAYRAQTTCREVNATLGTIYYNPYKDAPPSYSSVMAQPSNYPQALSTGAGPYVIIPQASGPWNQADPSNQQLGSHPGQQTSTGQQTSIGQQIPTGRQNPPTEEQANTLGQVPNPIQSPLIPEPANSEPDQLPASNPVS